MKKKRMIATVVALGMMMNCAAGCGNAPETYDPLKTKGNVASANPAFQAYVTESAPGGEQLVRSVYVDASPSGTKAGTFASYAVDSHENTKWVSAATSGTQTKEVVFLFDSVCDIGRIELTSEALPAELEYQGSTDGTVWFPIKGTISEGVFSASEIRPALMVKLLASGIPQRDGEYRLEISEIDFYTSESVSAVSASPSSALPLSSSFNTKTFGVSGEKSLTFDYGKSYAFWQVAVRAKGALPGEIELSYREGGTDKLIQQVTELQAVDGWQIFEFDVVNTDRLTVSTKGDSTLENVLAYQWNTKSHHWAATDGLGRSVAEGADLSYGARQNKFVGIFYFTWQFDNKIGYGPYNISENMKQHPDALETGEGFGGIYDWHWWGESIYGYYNQNDEWVIRKDAQMLADAGVDTLIFDNTNVEEHTLDLLTYNKQITKLLDVYTKIRAEGGKTPQVMFFMANTGHKNTRLCIDYWWDKMYSKGLYSDLWFRWDNNKPVMMAVKDAASTEQQEFFEFRAPNGTGFEKSLPDTWNWLTTYPQSVFTTDYDPYEQMSASTAQNMVIDPKSLPDRSQHAYVTAFSEGRARGRDFSDGTVASNSEMDEAVAYGRNFEEQLGRVLEVDPRFVFLTGWNEWIMQRLNNWWGLDYPNMFVDSFDERYNRDIMPMKGGYGDATYYQMVDFIRRYKGVDPAPLNKGGKTVGMGAGFGDFLSVPNVYYDDIGDVSHRDHVGFNLKTRYKNETGRNDIVLSKVTYDDDNIYFYVRTKDELTSCQDPAWMRLFIKTEGKGWGGYDYVINRVSPSKTTAVLEHSSGAGWSWTKAGDVQYVASGREMKIAIPRSMLNLTGAVNFQFKWMDNMQNDGDTDDFMIFGDAAPSGRFNYVFRSNEDGRTPGGKIPGSGR